MPSNVEMYCTKCTQKAIFATIRKDYTMVRFLCAQHFADAVSKFELTSVKTIRQYIQDTRTAPSPIGFV